MFISGPACSVVWGQAVQTRGWREGGVRGGREGTGVGGGDTLLPAVSSLTLHFLPIHTLTGTAAIPAWRLRAHKIRLISSTEPASQSTCLPHPPRPSVRPLADRSGLCNRAQSLNCELNIQEFPFRLRSPPSPFKHNVEPEHEATFYLHRLLM